MLLTVKWPYYSYFEGLICSVYCNFAALTQITFFELHLIIIIIMLKIVKLFFK